ncbi:MAG: HdeD family acid-resistance protein [Terracidiphilus sp.]
MGTVKNVIKEVTGASIGWGVIMIVLGLLAVILPFATGIAVSVVVSWLIVVTGLAYVVSAFAGRNARAFIWRLLIGLVYVLGGGYLGLHPNLALLSFTIVMAVIFAIEGVLELVTFFQFRGFLGSGWVLFDAIVTLLLAVLVGLPWPSSSNWAIGVILGVNLTFTGATVLMYSAAARKALEEIR